jgi:hypothetical protein
VNFAKRHVQAAAVQTITKEELLGFFDHYIAAAAPERSKLAVHTVSAKFAEEYAANPTGQEDGEEDAALAGPLIEATVVPEDGIAAWKAGMEVHPATRTEDDGLTATTY